MTDPNDAISKHYTIDDLQERVFAALKKEHGSLDNLSIEDVAAVDSFHIRGRVGTVELADRVGFREDWHVLDVGSGPGGTARYLSNTYGCRTTGIDLTPSFVDLADALSKLVGMQDPTQFECGNALSMPFEDASFDSIWLEHVQMSIPDKDALNAELHRVLKPGGTLALHEIFLGPQGDPQYPAPWADTIADSFLVTPDSMRQSLEAQSFEIVDWRDVSAPSRDWFQAAAKRSADSGPPTLGIHLVINALAPDKLTNMRGNLEEDRVAVIQGIARKI